MHADCPESVIFQASPASQPAFWSVAYLLALKRVKKLLEDFPDVLSPDSFTAWKPHHGVRHHLLTNPGPPVFDKPQRLDPVKLSAAKDEFLHHEESRDYPKINLSMVFSSSYG